MFKKICSFIVICLLSLMLSGCNTLLGAMMSAGAAYGLYQVTRK